MATWSGRELSLDVVGSVTSHSRRGLSWSTLVRGTRIMPDRPHAVFVHPVADLYGSDRMLLASIRAAVEAGYRVTAILPEHGPLVDHLESGGVAVHYRASVVLRKALLRPAGVLELLRGLADLPRLATQLRRARADVVYVNTITVPFWLLAARLAGIPTVCHVHEAEHDANGLVRRLLALPLFAARRVIAISAATADLLRSDLPPLRRRLVVITNGVEGPPSVPTPLDERPAVARLLLVGRLAPRKGTDVALAAVRALLHARRDVTLDLVGDVFPGYEWFREQLVAEVEQHGLQETIRFQGFTEDVWRHYAEAHIVLVPSRTEPFGNVAVEGQLAGRIVVASAVQGLEEIVTDGVDGLLVPPGDSAALGDAIERCLDAWDEARSLATRGATSAERRFGLDRYRQEIGSLLDATTVRS
jgi:glycosyltransferase involved in cell wall biosynthesis